MTTKTRGLRSPIAGPSSEQRDAWLAQRRNGITATEVAKGAAGRPADIHKIITEKVTGAHVDLTGNKFVDYGNEREPVIAEYARQRFSIAPSSILYSHAENLRYLATPDGFVDDAFTGERIVEEIKTSRYDLWPFPFARDYVEHGVPTLTPSIAARAITAVELGTPVTGFWKTTYYDQMQWQMFVCGATRCLFAAEQHDDNWPNPKPLRPADVMWVERDDARIAYLIEVADRLLKQIDAATPDSIAPASMIDTEIAEHMHQYLHAHGAVKTAEAVKGEHWAWLQARFKNIVEFRAENDEAKITWAAAEKSVTTFSTDLLDEQGTPAQHAKIDKAQTAVTTASMRVERAQAALAKANEALVKADARLEDARKPFSVTVIERGTPRLTITAKTTKGESA